MDSKLNLIELLEYIDPSCLSYQEWTNVGMALKHEGYTAHDWDTWSVKDSSRYVAGECYKKWDTFNEMAGNIVTGGTIVQYAKENGWSPTFNYDKGRALEWNDVIEKDDLVIIDKHYLEGVDIHEPQYWNPVNDLIRYLEVLFQASDYVGYVVNSMLNNKNKYVPASNGIYTFTAGYLIDKLKNCNGDIGAVLGDYDPKGGAWIRFNPLDGKGSKNENVADFRYALVESDFLEIEKQNAIIRELELPVACLVHSGGKSIHAIVKIEAQTFDEYRKRVSYLYDVCKKNGLKVDTQNRNPSRLSRMPGILRNGKKQFLIDTNIGKESWQEWEEWIEAVNDDLPDVETLSDVWSNLPDKAEPLIENVLRQGHKMLISGPSKAGKSFLLIELCIAIAEGKKWCGFDCTQGRVMYVNLELDRASCLHRFADVYKAMNIQAKNINKIDMWNLRGKTLPMDKLAPKLIRRAQKKEYSAIIIDPIYKVITGDENSADQMAAFCNQFDKVCNELGAATIYCHHHSKGAQGNKKAADRASGSGVFARDPDAILDLIELEIPDSLKEVEVNKKKCTEYVEYIKKHNYDYYESEVGVDDMLSPYQMKEHAKECLSREKLKEIEDIISKVEKDGFGSKTAWRIEGTLREFPSFNPIDLWFDYPIHKNDKSDMLKDLQSEGYTPMWTKGVKQKQANKEKKELEAEQSFYMALGSKVGDPITLEEMAQYLGKTTRTTRNWIKKYGYYIDKNTGHVIKKSCEK